MPTRPAVRAVCVGVSRPLVIDGRPGSSAIDKRPVDGRVAVTTLGLAGDVQADRRRHGGPDQALYAYASEDADHWSSRLGRETPSGVFGENLRTVGIDVTGTVIGQRWRIGDVVLEATAPRIPCRTFAAFWGVEDLVDEFLSAGRPGVYLRVIRQGAVGAADAIEVLPAPAHGLTVGEVVRIRTADRSQAGRLLQVPELAERLRTWAVGANGAPTA